MSFDFKAATPIDAPSGANIMGAANTSATNPDLYNTSGSGKVVLGTAPPVDNALGYLNIPQVGGAAKTGNYTGVLNDQGYMAVMNATTLTYTIPANASVAYPVGTVLTIVNIFAGNLTIAITSDTLTLAGSTTTGSRTLAQNGVATAIKVTSTTWLISGSGLT